MNTSLLQRIFPLLLSLTFFSSEFIMAYPHNSNLSRFRDEVEALNRACARGTCREPYARETMTVVSDDAFFVNLRSRAFDLAQVWADTILEGDYLADGNTQLEKVEVLKKEGQVFGYRVQYFERGWYIGQCEFNEQDLSTLAKCDEGKISESAYFNADLSLFYRDPAHFVTFESNNP